MLSTRTSSEKSTEDDEDFDAIYNNPQEETVDVKKHGSVLTHLISQISFGMSLGNVTLPAFILERRSLLEMYAEFFAHPDDFVGAVELLTPEDRFLNVVKYYMNSFYPARKSGVAKKPYNPILGEHFRCRWTLPDTEPAALTTRKGPFPGSGINQLTFLAEQVSHHPPTSAFYAKVKNQESKESRRLWRRVTAALFRNNIEEATLAKQLIEQRQRDARAEREHQGQEWTTRFFTPDDVGGWQFKESLEARLRSGEI